MQFLTRMGNGEEIPVREWEVVSMTESTYAAASNSSNTVGLERDEIVDDGTSSSSGKDAVETSRYMSAFRDLVFPPSQHENLPLEPEVFSDHENEDVNEEGDFGSANEGMRSGWEQQNRINIKGYHFPIFDAKGNLVTVAETEPTKPDVMLRPAQLRSSQSEVSGSALFESSVINDEVTEPYDQGSDSNVSNFPKHRNNDNAASNNLPCGAWWNRKVASLYAQAKETNGFGSICVAAAILGLLILGQHWQQERWQLLQLKWHSSVFDEKVGRMLGPLTRLKDLIIGGQRRGSLISSSDS